MLIDFMVSMHQTHSCAEVMTKLENWIKVRSLLAWSAGLDWTWLLCTLVQGCPRMCILYARATQLTLGQRNGVHIRCSTDRTLSVDQRLWSRGRPHRGACEVSCVAERRRRSQEHRQDADRSKLKRLVPSIGQMFTDLPLVAAFEEYDRHFSLSRRRFVPPNFAEMRHILNIAQYVPLMHTVLDVGDRFGMDVSLFTPLFEARLFAATAILSST
jgi:IMP-specific 5'-nucleotidase